MIFESGKTELKMPIIRLVSNEFRFGTKSIVEFEIINENSTSIEDVVLTVTKTDGEVEVVEPAPIIQKIDPLNISKAKVALRFYRKIESKKSIDVTVEFKLLGRTYTHNQNLPIQMKSLMEKSKL
jgi:hypothetical protein